MSLTPVSEVYRRSQSSELSSPVSKTKSGKSATASFPPIHRVRCRQRPSERAVDSIPVARCGCMICMTLADIWASQCRPNVNQDFAARREMGRSSPGWMVVGSWHGRSKGRGRGAIRGSPWTRVVGCPCSPFLAPHPSLYYRYYCIPRRRRFRA
ncbi:hypothetical protein BO94DRAFT_592236 [Aspergillus sclerotioniger CBS 115572]|uniref:Uncharacterized protein n=1 Tax=Aspergillus sclerotioniger CBS 115572 TaxID=1450535 RepID=A0A317XFC2_9EURO|nr:hypothetical protein BO94DRAFT_592236 [Aspergillus sclerotioniger CBS 115572]PWY96467.1 hypothetical protein BO94DRAFT_592236 [Aspergillus sclerotioniger CBS 115572]